MPPETLPLRGQMAEEKEVMEGETAEEALMGLGGGAMDLSGGEALPQRPPVLSERQIIACAVIGAVTGNATAEELGALRGRSICFVIVLTLCVADGLEAYCRLVPYEASHRS